MQPRAARSRQPALLMRAALAGLCALALSACGGGAQPGPPDGPANAPAFHDADPALLSDWGQLRVEGGRLVLSGGVTPYTLNTALFSDYAQKLRTVWLPEGAEPAAHDPEDVFAFPVGTVITKTFYYPRAGSDFTWVAAEPDLTSGFDGQGLDLGDVRLIETRILVRRAQGWAALPYVWDDDQSEARLARTGGFVELTLIAAGGRGRDFAYMVPNVNQCASCHATDLAAGAIRPIGPKARHLNLEWDALEGANQLDLWRERGLLDPEPPAHAEARAARWTGEAIPIGPALDDTARAYLDINCAHCHAPSGPAASSGLNLGASDPLGPSFGVCKPPIAAGRGTGGHRFSIVPGEPDASIFVHRMDSTRPDVMMPELGRATIHSEGVALVAAWIGAMAGGCG
jgi:uncharacterized repeat protein (TIGR03806 family)